MKRKKQFPNIQNNENQVLLEPNKYPTLKANLEAYGIKLKGPNGINDFSAPKASVIDTRSPLAQDLFKSQDDFMKLVKNNDPTQIPYVTTSIGNILVNPSTVSLATLMKIAQNEIVAKCMEMNVISVLNSLGNIYHDNKDIQKFLRYNIETSNGGMREIVEKMFTAQYGGFSLSYIRDYIDNDGYTRFGQLDLLPQSTVLFSATARGDVENIYQYVYSYPYANTQNLFSFPFNFAGSGYGDDIPYCGNGVDPLAGFGNVDYTLRTNILNTFGIVALDKEKCVHFIYDGIIKIANPYGWNPLSRRVYDLVLLYDLYKQLHSTFLSYKACPLLVGYAKSNQTVDDPTGNGATLTAISALHASLSTMGFNGALLLSGLKDDIYHIEAINTQGDTTAFKDALNWYANQIQECLGMFNFDEGSFASATAQTSIYGRLTYNWQDKISYTIKTTIFKYLIHKNFSTKIFDYGRFENEIQNLDDKVKQAKIFSETAIGQGFNPIILKKDNDFQRLTLQYPLLTDEEFKKLQDETRAQNLMADHPMDNTNRVNSRESKEHYKKGKNSDV